MGYSPRTAVGTALVFATVVKLFASAEYRLRSQIHYRVLGFLLLGGIPGAFGGAILLERLHFDRANQWILCGIGAVILVSALTSIFNIRAPRESVDKLRLLPLFSFPIALETGFSSSGSGALGTVLLFRWTSLSPSMVVGTDLVFGLIISAIAGGVHAFSGTCNWSALATLIPAGVVDSFLGVRTCTALPRTTLRKSILVCAAGIGCSLLMRGVEGIL
jgi:uncharacterized membrane protein YfcA